MNAPESVDWLEEAGSLEDQILAHARRTPSGEVVWLHPVASDNAGSPPVRVGPQLYDGVAGLALFLGALEHIEPREGRRDLILSTLAPVRHFLRTLAADGAEEGGAAPFSLGGFTGLGGFLYAFLLLSRWLGEPELLADAVEIATLVTPERIAADDVLDVMKGCAGTALALLALDRVAPAALRGKGPAERAAECGEHLLARRVPAGGEPRGWPTKDLPPRCGFAHGAAGISYCLTRLFERTGDARFREAAEEGIAFEHGCFDSEHGNWPLPGVPGQRFMTAWCSGAPGVALGRLGMTASGSAPVQQDLRAALDTTATCALVPVDSLCCGNMGRSDILLQAHKVLGEDRLLAAAEETATQVVLRSRERGGHYYWPTSGGRFALSFFGGAAGVGYTLLRLARPSLLPCVLSLEMVG